MKGFALALFCFVALAQGRNTGDQPSSRALATLGDAPWLVHLRLASYSGLLSTCAGSLIEPRWLLTTASCVNSASFIWARYGVVNVIYPELVTENAFGVRIHPSYDVSTGQNNVALISINRYVHSTDNITPIALQKSEVVLVGSSKFCGFGESAIGGAGDQLSCYEVSVTRQNDNIIVTPDSVDAYASEFDHGAPLVTDDIQVGLLVQAPLSEAGAFLPVAPYIQWIEQIANISL